MTIKLAGQELSKEKFTAFEKKKFCKKWNKIGTC